MNLEGVQDLQNTLEAEMETREEPQGIVESPLKHKDNEVLIEHVLNFKDGIFGHWEQEVLL